MAFLLSILAAILAGIAFSMGFPGASITSALVALILSLADSVDSILTTTLALREEVVNLTTAIRAKK